MELTGSLYQDYTNLKNLYNQYGKYPLYNSPSDVNYNVMLHLNVKELSRFCRTNKQAQDLCTSRDFWRLKYEYEGLPFLPDIEGDGSDDADWWLRQYDDTKKADEYVKLVLEIYNVELKRSPDKSQFICIPDLDGMNYDNLEILNHIYKEQLFNSEQLDDLFEYEIVLEIQKNTTKEDKYALNIKKAKSAALKITVFLTTKDVILLLTITQAYIYHMYDRDTMKRFVIRDSNNLPFVLTENQLDFLARRMKGYDETKKLTLQKRLGMIEYIKYSEKIQL